MGCGVNGPRSARTKPASSRCASSAVARDGTVTLTFPCASGPEDDDSSSTAARLHVSVYRFNTREKSTLVPIPRRAARAHAASATEVASAGGALSVARTYTTATPPHMPGLGGGAARSTGARRTASKRKKGRSAVTQRGNAARSRCRVWTSAAGHCLCALPWLGLNNSGPSLSTGLSWLRQRSRRCRPAPRLRRRNGPARHWTRRQFCALVLRRPSAPWPMTNGESWPKRCAPTSPPSTFAFKAFEVGDPPPTKP